MEPTPKQRREIAQHNFWFMLIEGALFHFAMSFLDGNTIVSVFIERYTGSLQLAGLASALRTNAVVLSNVTIGIFIHVIPSHTRYLRRMGYLTRPLLLWMVPTLLLGASGPAAAYIFIALYGLFFLSDGFISLPWLDVMARTIPSRDAGRMLGYQHFVGGALALIAGVLIKIVMDQPWSDAVRYAIVFGGAGTILAINALFLGRLRDVPRELEPRADVRAYFRRFVPLFRANADYRIGVLARVLYTVAVMVYPLLSVYGRLRLGISAGQQSTLITIQVFGILVGGFLWGQVSGRIGCRYVILMGMVATVLTAVLALLAPLTPAPYACLVAAVLLAGVNNGNYTGYTTYIAEISDEKHRSQYLVMQGLCVFPFGFAPILAGRWADASGFAPVLVAAGIVGLGGVVACLMIVRKHRAARAQADAS